MGNIDTLKILDHALELAVLTYSVTAKFPASERFGLIDQMRRASVSVGSNIAEGSGRGTKPQLLQFLGMSGGSVSELEFQSRLARRLSFGDASMLITLAEYAAEQRRMNLGYARWVRGSR